jgi:hypothetical protein
MAVMEVHLLAVPVAL